MSVECPISIVFFVLLVFDSDESSRRAGSQFPASILFRSSEAAPRRSDLISCCFELFAPVQVVKIYFVFLVDCCCYSFIVSLQDDFQGSG
jgi:hypothetical protein